MSAHDKFAEFSACTVPYMKAVRFDHEANEWEHLCRNLKAPHLRVILSSVRALRLHTKPESNRSLARCVPPAAVPTMLSAKGVLLGSGRAIVGATACSEQGASLSALPRELARGRAEV